MALFAKRPCLTQESVTDVDAAAPAAKVEIPDAETEGPSNDEDVKKLMDRPWSDLSPDERNTLVKNMPVPTQTQYRQFHAEMAKKAPDGAPFTNKYKEVASTVAQRGRSTGKAANMRALCQQWVLAKEEATEMTFQKNDLSKM